MNTKINSKRLMGWLALCAGIGALGYFTAREVFVRTYAQTDIQVRPFVAQQIGFKIVAGREVMLERKTESRRRDASVHKVGTMYRDDGTEAGTFRRVDFADGLVGMIIDSIKAKATGRNRPRRVAAYKAFLLNPPPNCASRGYVVDGEEWMFGQRAIRLIRQASPESLEREMSWMLPDFNCATLQMFMQRKDATSGQWQTAFGFRLVSFIEVDPEENVFSNWSHYEEMKPSDLKRKLAEKAGLTPQTCPECFASDHSDMNYQLANPR